MTDKTTSNDVPADADLNEKGNNLQAGAPDKGGNKKWMGTAVGVGSAALVAALMYANRRNKKG